MSDSPYIVEINQANVQAVLQKSAQVPVLLDFWAAWCQPCKQLMPILAKLANEYKGRFILAKVDTDAFPDLAQQLGVRSLPTLKLVFRGQLAGELSGLQPESEIRRLLDAVVEPAADSADADQEADPWLAQVDEARRVEAYEDAIALLQQAMNEHPDRLVYQATLAEVLMDVGQLDEAQAVLDHIKDETAKARARARLFLIREIYDGPTPEELTQALSEDPENVPGSYFMALHQLMAGDVETGLEMLLAVIRKDRAFREDAARKAYITALELLGNDNPLVSRYRRRLFALMH